MSNENIEITDEAIAEFVDGGLPSFHPILFVWREVLKNAPAEKEGKVTAAFAHRITSAYREVDYADMLEYSDRYFDKIIELNELLLAEIATDDQCLTYTSAEEDVEHNGHHYKQLLLDWQKLVVVWENNWDCTASDAGIELAAISEVHKMFFGQTGIVGYLQNIQFEFTEADQAEMEAELNAVKEGKVDGE